MSVCEVLVDIRHGCQSQLCDLVFPSEQANNVTCSRAVVGSGMKRD